MEKQNIIEDVKLCVVDKKYIHFQQELVISFCLHLNFKQLLIIFYRSHKKKELN